MWSLLVVTLTTASPQACVEPRADALAREHAAADAVVDEKEIDLDSDGSPDVVVTTGSGRERPHFLYVKPGGCGRFVGRIEAAMLGRREGQRTGLGDLWVDTWLMHGDRLRCEWRASSGPNPTYEPSSRCIEVPGPRRDRSRR